MKSNVQSVSFKRIIIATVTVVFSAMIVFSFFQALSWYVGQQKVKDIAPILGKSGAVLPLTDRDRMISPAFFEREGENYVLYALIDGKKEKTGLVLPAQQEPYNDENQQLRYRDLPFSAAVSPNGAKIAYLAKHNPKELEQAALYISNLDGTDREELAFPGSNYGHGLIDSKFFWSSDSQRILYVDLKVSEGGNAIDLYSIDIQTKVKTKIASESVEGAPDTVSLPIIDLVPAGFFRGGIIKKFMTDPAVQAEQARLEKLNTHRGDQRINQRDYPKAMGEYINDKLKIAFRLSEVYACSLICPDNGKVYLIYDGIDSREECAKVNGKDVVDSFADTYIGCAPDIKPDAPSVSHGGPVTDYISLADNLRYQQNAVVEPKDEVLQPLFSVAGLRISVNGGDVDVFEHSSAAVAYEESLRVSADGSQVGNAAISWAGAPHFYRTGKLIVLYVGKDQNVINVLEAALGKQFAGRE